MQHTDTSLWHSFLAGDQSSFETIYTLNYKSLYEYAIRRLGQEEAVKDCLQDLFTKLWSNRRNLRPTDNIKYYLFTALKHSLVNMQTTHNRLPGQGTIDPEQFTLDFEQVSLLEQKEQNTLQLQKLLAAMNELTGRQKEVIYLRYFEEMEYTQIAELLDISVKGVYKLNYRALETLKEILAISKKDLLVLLMLLKTIL